MNPAARLGLSLVASLVLWFPTLQATMRGDADLFTASFRYLLAFGLARVAVGLLSQMVTTYAATLHTETDEEPERDGQFGRRREDIPDLAAAADD